MERPLLPSNMDSLRSLEELILSRCSELANLPEYLWKLKRLKILYLSGMSRLEEMGLTSIRCLSSLKYLALADNSFVTLPTSISQLSKLEALDRWMTSGTRTIQRKKKNPTSLSQFVRCFLFFFNLFLQLPILLWSFLVYRPPQSPFSHFPFLFLLFLPPLSLS